MLDPVTDVLLGLVLAAQTMTPLTAAEANEPSAGLPTMVVVATRSSRDVADIAASVTVIDEARIASQLVASPADLVRYDPAITVPRTGTRFGSDSYSIRGIGGNRVAIEIDGVPVSDQFDVGSFSNAQRDLVDVGVISRVEVLRGPASTLYGSDAIGGVVAYTTLSAADLNGDLLRLRSAYRSDDNSLSQSVTSGWSSDRFGALVSVTRREGDQLDAAASAETADQRQFDSTAAFARLDWDLTPSLRLTATVDDFQRAVDSNVTSVLGSGRFRSTTLLTGDDQQDRQRFSLNLAGQSNLAWAQSYRALVYRQDADTQQLTLEERAGGDLRRQRQFDFLTEAHGLELGGEANASWLGMEHRIGYGLDLQKSRVTERRDALQSTLAGDDLTRSVLGETFPLRDFPISRITEIGFYLHDEWRLRDHRWILIPALRFDQYRLDPRPDSVYLEDNPGRQVARIRESRWSPRLGLLFDPTERSNLFAQYARGFRAPPFADANIGLDIPLFNVRAIPNPDLKSEVSDTLELGFRWQGSATRLNATVHYTAYRNFIESKVRIGADPDSGVIEFQSRNLDSAHIYGVELALQQNLDAWSQKLTGLDLDLSLAWTESRNSETGQPLASVSPAEVTAGLNWQSESLPLAASLRATAVAPMRDASRVNTLGDSQFQPAGFALVDLLASYQLRPSVVIRAGVFNLAGRRYWRWADVRGLETDDPLVPSLSAPGRNAGVSLSFAW